LVYYPPHCRIHFRMPVPKGIGADAHDAHVQQLAIIKIPDMTASGATEIRRPSFWQKHFGPLGQQHVSARYYLLDTLPKFLTGTQGRTLVAGQVLVGLKEAWLVFA